MKKGNRLQIVIDGLLFTFSLLYTLKIFGDTGVQSITWAYWLLIGGGILGCFFNAINAVSRLLENDHV